ncbi:MAG: HAD-IIB family hydrolase [Oscillospiraceae bacterium]
MTLYATDLDGTLLRSDKTISDSAAQKLNALIESGVLFTYATARSFNSASPLLGKLNLTCPAVTFNGVFVVDPKTGEHIIENVFTDESFETAKRFFIKHDLAPIVYSYIDGRERVSYIESRLDEVRGYVESRRGDRRLRAVEGYGELFEGRVFYFTLFDPPVEISALDSVFCAENGFSRSFMKDTYDDMMWYEIFGADADKAKAVAQVKALVGADRTVCFGDNGNDLSMISAADTGVAVGNANGELKSAADIIIGTNDEDAVADFITRRESPETSESRFAAAVNAALSRQKGMHGSVGTQNEKLIHAVLKNYYAPFADEQEIKLGRFFADAVSEDGIFEIQTRSLYLLKDKLREFLGAARVTVVHPVDADIRTLYVSTDSGEVVKETPRRRVNPKLKIFEELYSLREFLPNENLSFIIVRLSVDKTVYFSGSKIPDMRSRSVRKKLTIQKIPRAIVEEIRLERPEDYLRWLPEGLPESFTKKQFCAAAKEPASSLRLEVLRAVGLITQTGKTGRSNLYTVTYGKEREQ